jgi:hypothetical protein
LIDLTSSFLSANFSFHALERYTLALTRTF